MVVAGSDPPCQFLLTEVRKGLEAEVVSQQGNLLEEPVVPLAGDYQYAAVDVCYDDGKHLRVAARNLEGHLPPLLE